MCEETEAIVVIGILFFMVAAFVIAVIRAIRNAGK